MASLHLMVGFLGFGKTTLAKQIASDMNGVCLSHDEIMLRLYGRNPPEKDFQSYYKIVDDLIWEITEKIIKAKTPVVLDYSGWDKNSRAMAYNRALKFTDDIIFHQILCDLNIAKKRVLQRTNSDPNALYIDENCFNILLNKYQAIGQDENYNIVYHTT